MIDLNEPPDINDPDVVPGDNIQPGIERFYSERKRYNAFAGLRYSLTDISNLALRYRYLKTNYNFKGNTDYDVQSANLIYLRKLLGQRDVVGARVGYAYYTSDVSDADSYMFALIWRHLFTETMSLYADIGARYTDRTFDQTDLRTDSWTSLANIKFVKLGETNEINIGFNLDLQSASDGTIENVPRLYGEFKQEISERFWFRCKGNFYVRENDINFKFGKGDLFFDILPSLEYRITENYSLSLAYSYTVEYDRNLEDDPSTQRNRVWLMLEMEFPNQL